MKTYHIGRLIECNGQIIGFVENQKCYTWLNDSERDAVYYYHLLLKRRMGVNMSRFKSQSHVWKLL